MDIEILSPKTLKCYPCLEEQIGKWAELSSIPVNGLLVRVLNGSLLEKEWDALLRTFDPRDLTKGMPVIGHYKPPSLIELDVIIDKPRWGLLAFYFFHELGHHKDYLQGIEITEKSADAFATQMVRKIKGVLPRSSK